MANNPARGDFLGHGRKLKASAIIVAAGSGVRLGPGVPKAFVKIGGRTMLSYSLGAVGQVSAIGEVVITVPEGFESAARAEAAAAGLGVPVKITPGGIERQDSVRIALGLTSSESELVIVHDAARPLARPAIFEACMAAAARAGGAIAAIPVADTLKRVADSGSAIVETVGRAGLWQAQTPQAFRRAVLVAAHQRAVNEGIVATDDADLVERTGVRVEVVEGSTANIKITTPSDLAIAEAIIAAGMAQ
ncbi:2-C-methyl-D-erythritol 4-phosphate cytidylyltransferase [Candidatus Binatus sp.]|uniref:2-C-methyl-D-erythritol 4-phosphate cytidylyltransferase n=1 Tax=Candidatus Binatus sp. TaxID=2811406 RepID=UPI002F92B591